MLTITGEVASVTVNVYTNVFTVTGTISPIIVTNGSVYTNGCYKP